VTNLLKEQAGELALHSSGRGRLPRALWGAPVDAFEIETCAGVSVMEPCLLTGHTNRPLSSALAALLLVTLRLSKPRRNLGRAQAK
jgi:hypothetical protein